MELLDYEIDMPASGMPFYVHVFSDVHRCALGCDARKFRADIAALKAGVEAGERHYWLAGGDLCNAIGPKDRRYDAAAIAPEFREFTGDDLFAEEVATLARELAPIRDYGLGICTGNHEDNIARRYEYNMSKALARKLDLPYLGYTTVVRFRVGYPRGERARGGRNSLLFFWHHGRGAARSDGAKLNMLLKFREIVTNADVYGCGHVHQIVGLPKARMEASRGGKLVLDTKPVLFFNAGTYQRAYGVPEAQESGKYDANHPVKIDYAERVGYEPSAIGHTGFSVRRTRDHKNRTHFRCRMVDWR